jgi:hypothetical protein
MTVPQSQPETPKQKLRRLGRVIHHINRLDFPELVYLRDRLNSGWPK